MAKDLARSAVGGRNGETFSQTSVGAATTISVPARCNYVLLQVPGSSSAKLILRFDETAPTRGDGSTGFTIPASDDAFFNFYLPDGVSQLDVASADGGNTADVNTQFFSIGQSRVAP